MKLRTKLILGSLVIGAIAFAASPKAIGAVLQLSNVAFASFPSAAAINEGGLLYDSTNDVVKYSNGSSWLNVGLTPGGQPNEVQYNSAGTAFGGISNLSTNGVYAIIGADAGNNPANPTAAVALYGRVMGSSSELAAKGTTQLEYPLGPTPWGMNWFCWRPSGSTAILVSGSNGNTGEAVTSGTIAQASDSTFGAGTDDWRWRWRTSMTTSGTSNGRAYAQSTGAGATANNGQFLPFVGWNFETVVNARRVSDVASYWAGFVDPVATMFTSAVQPCTTGWHTTFAGFATQDGGNEWLACVGQGGTVSQKSLGPNFPVRDAGTGYLMRMTQRRGGGDVCYSARNLYTDAGVSDCLSSGVPANDTFVTPLIGLTTGHINNASSLDLTYFCGWSIE